MATSIYNYYLNSKKIFLKQPLQSNINSTSYVAKLPLLSSKYKDEYSSILIKQSKKLLCEIRAANKEIRNKDNVNNFELEQKVIVKSCEYYEIYNKFKKHTKNL